MRAKSILAQELKVPLNISEFSMLFQFSFSLESLFLVVGRTMRDLLSSSYFCRIFCFDEL